MGMLLHHQREKQRAGEAKAKPRKRSARKSAKATEPEQTPEQPETPTSPYAELSDDELLEAATLTLGEQDDLPSDREGLVAALDAAAAEAAATE